MARGTTLGQILNDLRIEIGLDPNPAMSLNLSPKLRQSVQREQERLYDDFAWPFLKIRADVPMSSGERYYDVPDTLNLEHIETVEYQWGGKWFPLDRGITSANYNQFNSDAGVSIDPAYRWDLLDTGEGVQIEIWPMPLSNGNLVRIVGRRKLNAFIDDADRADLDDQVLVLLVAAEFIDDERKAQEKRQKGIDRLHRLQGLAKTNRSGGFGFGAPAEDARTTYRAPLVAYVRNQ